MTRGRSEVFPSAGTRRRAAALGVDAGLMDAVDALTPRLSVAGWRALAAKAGRPVEDVMLDELIPLGGLGLHDEGPGSTSSRTPSPHPTNVFEVANLVDDAPPYDGEELEVWS